MIPLLPVVEEFKNNCYAVVSLIELFLPPPKSDVSVVVAYCFRMRRILRVTLLVTMAAVAIAVVDATKIGDDLSILELF